MTTFALSIVVATVVLFLYTYFGYPALLWILGQFTRRDFRKEDPEEWPTVSITVPAYNEGHQIRELCESLLAIEYPRDKLQILIVSDCSDDGTDEVVEEYADRGIDLLRMPERGGKTKAENTATQHLTGEYIVNTDASIRIQPKAVKLLIAALQTPEVGCASGRDISIAPGETVKNAAEGGYVGYEMAIRDLETRVSGIIGSSGCLYATRAELHRITIPDELSRDFASALKTKEAGLRTVSVPDATCLVPRATSLRKEYRRKVRTIRRGFETLMYKKQLMNPIRYPSFSFMLVSHKLCRWALPWMGLASLAALAILAPGSPVALGMLVFGLLILGLALVGWLLAGDPARRIPKLFSIPAFVVFGNLAAVDGLIRAVRGGGQAFWEPTRRETIGTG